MCLPLFYSLYCNSVYVVRTFVLCYIKCDISFSVVVIIIIIFTLYQSLSHWQQQEKNIIYYCEKYTGTYIEKKRVLGGK